MAKKQAIDKIRSPRNRTLFLEKTEIPVFKERLLPVSSEVLSIDDITNKTIHGDLMEALKVLPQGFADLIIVDPPYNLTKDFSGMKFSRMKNFSYLEYLHSWFPQVVRLLKPQGSLYLCGDWQSTSFLFSVIDEFLVVMNRITWQREKGRGAQKNWKNGMEDIWFGVQDPKNYYFDVDAVKMKRRVNAPYRENGLPKDWEETKDGRFRMTYPSNFWDDITVPYWSMPENTDHPTQKPEKLIAKLILASCPPNGMVFDPFLGSGTTSVVAKKLGRNYCGVEQSEEYCCLAEKRLQKAEADSQIQGYQEGIFWQRNAL